MYKEGLKMESALNENKNKKMSEKEAATLFFEGSLATVNKNWKDISAFLEKVMETKIDDEVASKFEYAMALIAIQMQALPKLLQLPQALRVRNHLMEYLAAKGEEGRFAIDLIKKYEDAWNYAKTIIGEQKAVSGKDSFNSRYEPPHFKNPLEAVGTILSDTFYDRTSIETMGGEKREYKLSTVQLLGESFASFGGYWQKFLSNVELSDD